jgi:hypothetical protein
VVQAAVFMKGDLTEHRMAFYERVIVVLLGIEVAEGLLGGPFAEGLAGLFRLFS